MQADDMHLFYDCNDRKGCCLMPRFIASEPTERNKPEMAKWGLTVYCGIVPSRKLGQSCSSSTENGVRVAKTKGPHESVHSKQIFFAAANTFDIQTG